MASISSLKKAELITIVERQAIEIADLKDALLHASNAATDAKHHAALMASSKKQTPGSDFREWAKSIAYSLGRAIRVDVKRQVILVDGREIPFGEQVVIVDGREVFVQPS